ncbi:tRNA-dihydrouridine synthase [Staphylococcus aureus]|uniref:tRNA dihydrouridine synthase n=1 Tax=Staphylococcus aureus TaxID=1280 RepID=UPI00301B8156
MKENFWSELPRPFFILAPMEDVTDIVFRHVVSEAARPDVFFTEFTNTESFCHPEGIHSVRGRLTFSEDEQPMVAHIWGDKPEQFRETSIQLAKMGFKGIDLNMGCPVANVAKKGKGSGLILRPDVAAEIIQNLRDEIAPNTLLTINGDIPDRKTGLELAEKYGIDGVMIGRGIFHNPFAFEKEPREHTSKELLDLLRLHLSLFNKYEKDEIRQFKSLRRFFKIYVRGIRGASELRHQLMNTQSIAEARALLDEFEAQMDEDVKIEL